jgi:hypothetical protein
LEFRGDELLNILRAVSAFLRGEHHAGQTEIGDCVDADPERLGNLAGCQELEAHFFAASFFMSSAIAAWIVRLAIECPACLLCFCTKAARSGGSETDIFEKGFASIWCNK